MTEEQPTTTTMTGDGNQPEGTGWAPPDTGDGDAAESEIPVGVDQIEHEAPIDDDAGGAPEGGTATIDVDALPDTSEGTARDATEAPVTGDAAEDAEAAADPEADADADADAEGAGDEAQATA